MRRAPIALLFALAAAAILVLPLPASAVPIHRHVWSKKILPDGVRQPILLVKVKDDVAPPYVPPKPEPVAVSSPALVAPTPAPTSYAPAPTTSGGCPSYMAAEASSPDAVNPSSGAAGCWQVTPGTQAAMGAACADVNATSCAAAICASQGPSAWASSGANPCPYVEP